MVVLPHPVRHEDRPCAFQRGLLLLKGGEIGVSDGFGLHFLLVELFEERSRGEEHVVS